MSFKRLQRALFRTMAAVVALVVFVLMYTLKDKELDRMNAELHGQQVQQAEQEV